MNPLINELEKFGHIAESVKKVITSRTKIIQKSKGGYLLKAGQILGNLFVIDTGLVRAFYIQTDKEINTWFGLEHTLLGSTLPLYLNKPATEYIQCLEDSTIYPLTTTDLLKIYSDFPEMNSIGRKTAESYCVFLEERIAALQTLTAIEKYKRLLGDYPDLVMRVSLGHIASFLGVTQETLSRIRKE
ncbi:Crp/Fnr family transcriptional regulator [Olivibacter sp. SDN3]|uniref:Crp/Fnr family transcriptional regulator n=1 Tax=Olivibacter sp. SDN3 TaxID=2764720 RepID=UPI001651570F|nr:Crp/Fnr family transcriptional regulator [Olivibacter sp. SDN3]QNL49224.1 Crp/Fnr family transcriptional regulator [Olivibacter sp. SDN3]